MKRILTLFSFCLAILITLGTPWSYASESGDNCINRINRQVAAKTTPAGQIEVALTIDAAGKSAAGLVETIPSGWSFPENDKDVSDAAHFWVDRSKGVITIASFGDKDLKYRVIPGNGQAGEFSGYFVDLLELSPDLDHDRNAWQTIEPAPGKPEAKPVFAKSSADAAITSTSLPCDNGDGRLTEDEIAVAVRDLLKGQGEYSLDDVSDAAYVLTFWDGRAKTVTDMNNRELTFYRPIERLISTNPDNSMLVIGMGLGDVIVGADECTIGSCVCSRDGNRLQHPKTAPKCWDGVCDGALDKIPQTSTRHTVNYELMASLKPDVILETLFWGSRADDMSMKVGVPVVVAGCDFDVKTWIAQIETVGRILDKEKEAGRLVQLCRDKIGMVTSVTDRLPDSEKPRVYFAPRGAKKGFYDPKEGRDFTRTYQVYDPLDLAGGVNVASGLTGENVNVSIEQIIAWNPEIILVACSAPADSGVEFLIKAQELQAIEAIRKSQVYNVFYPHCRGRPINRNLVNVLFLAKIFHPDKFKDLDVKKEGDEIYKAFLGVDGAFTEYLEYVKVPVN